MRQRGCEDPGLPVCGGRLQPVRGFSLVQLILALAGLLFASLVVPAGLAVRLNESRVARAERDAQAIAAAIGRFERDTGSMPFWSRAQAGSPGEDLDRLELLVGAGDMPRVAEGVAGGWMRGRRGTLADQLLVNAPGYSTAAAGGHGWAGPYLPVDRPDPWGNCYLVVPGRVGGPRVRVISAGPNGIVETDAEGPPDGFRGDDVVVR